MERAYRRFRRLLSVVPLHDAIQICWEIDRALESKGEILVWNDQPNIPNKIEAMRMNIAQWTVESLLREAFLHCPDFGTRSLRDWNYFAEVMNALGEVRDASWGDDRADLILYELFRIGHLQFPWQTEISGRYLTRYLSMYRRCDLDALISESFGLSSEQIIKIAVGLYGYFQDNLMTDAPFDFEPIGIRNEDGNAFVRRFSDTLIDARAANRHRQELNVNYSYTRSSLRQKPLIRLIGAEGQREALICPIPRLLIERVLDGLFYDLVSLPRFPNTYGPAFQNYVEHLAERMLGETFLVLREAKYGAAALRKDSIDLILQDGSANLFIECKSRRVSLRAQVDLTSIDAIHEEMDKICRAIFQGYKTVADALAGEYEHWQPNQNPSYLVIVTLHSWHIFSPTLWSYIRDTTAELCAAGLLDPEILNAVPFVICSASEYELLCGVLSRRQANDVFSLKTDGEHLRWEMHSFLNGHFRPEIEETAGMISDIDEFFDAIFEQP